MKTGFLGIFGNKGAINISLKIAEFSILVYAVHLQHGDTSYHKRNQNLEKIRRESKIPTKRKEPGEKSVFQDPIDKRADLVVLIGDLNYRTEGLEKGVLETALSQKKFAVTGLFSMLGLEREGPTCQSDETRALHERANGVSL